MTKIFNYSLVSWNIDYFLYNRHFHLIFLWKHIATKYRYNHMSNEYKQKNTKNEGDNLETRLATHLIWLIRKPVVSWVLARQQHITGVIFFRTEIRCVLNLDSISQQMNDRFWCEILDSPLYTKIINGDFYHYGKGSIAIKMYHPSQPWKNVHINWLSPSII